MFATKQEKSVAGAQEVFDHRGAAKVLKLDFAPEKAERQLEPWLAAGWEIKSVVPITISGQVIFLDAFLARRPR